MATLPEGGAAGAPQYYQWIFQWSFAATACTIVSGAIAERTRFEAYFFYSFFMAAWVYPIIVHSVWSTSGWANMNRANGPLLFQRGAIDFAGSGAVHMVGGERRKHEEGEEEEEEVLFFFQVLSCFLSFLSKENSRLFSPPPLHLPFPPPSPLPPPPASTPPPSTTNKINGARKVSLGISKN